MLGSLFNSKSERLLDSWATLASQAELEELFARSAKRPIALFKHSTRCGVSSAVKRKLEREWDLRIEQIEFHYLDLLAHRDVSNEIAQRTGVQHESPQLIVINGGKVIYQASHDSIDVADVKRAIGAGN